MKSKVLSFMVIFSMVLCVQAFAGGKKESSTIKENDKQLQNYIAESENKLKLIYDWEEKDQLYKDVISSINDFIWSSDNMSITNKYEKIAADWERRHNEFLSVTDGLIENLKSEMRDGAITMAKTRYPNRDLDNISVIGSDYEKRDDSIYQTFTYRVVMRGTVLGITTANVDVIVKGQINMRNNTKQILEARIK